MRLQCPKGYRWVKRGYLKKGDRALDPRTRSWKTIAFGLIGVPARVYVDAVPVIRPTMMKKLVKPGRPAVK